MEEGWLGRGWCCKLISFGECCEDDCRVLIMESQQNTVNIKHKYTQYYLHVYIYIFLSSDCQQWFQKIQCTDRMDLKALLILWSWTCIYVVCISEFGSPQRLVALFMYSNNVNIVITFTCRFDSTQDDKEILEILSHPSRWGRPC